MQTYTAQDLIVGALTQLGILGTGASLEPADAQNSLRALNEIVDTWATQRLTMPFLARTVVPLSPGKKTYTIGEGGDIPSLAPPPEIVYVNLLWPKV